MAKAPTPGVGRRRDENAEAKKILTLTLCGKDYTLAPNNMPIKERMAVRHATGGIPFEQFWNGEQSVGIDSLIVLWWLARRANGEADLSLDAASAEWPDELDEGDLAVRFGDPDPEAEDPEA